MTLPGMAKEILPENHGPVSSLISHLCKLMFWHGQSARPPGHVEGIFGRFPGTGVGTRLSITARKKFLQLQKSQEGLAVNDDHMAEAQARMARMALQLAAHFDPIRAACLLSGAALTLVRRNCGDEAAREFFAGIADEIGANPEIRN